MPSTGSYRLRMQAGPTPGKVYELTRDISTIGRDLRSDVMVNDAEVSRTHARLTAQADGYLVEDLMSTNGAYINGQRLNAPRLLRAGDILGLGDTVTLRLEIASEAEPTVASPEPALPAAPPPPAPEPAPARESQGLPSGLEGEPEAKKRGPLFWAAVGCGCLTLLACSVVFVAVGFSLWNAPLEFWQSIGLG